MLPDIWILGTIRAGKESAARVTGLSYRIGTPVGGHALSNRAGTELIDRHPELLDPAAFLTSTVGVPPVITPTTWEGCTSPPVFWEYYGAPSN
jgi:hypothetical protein